MLVQASSYATIAQTFSRLSNEEREKLQIKFDIALFVAKDTKHPKLCLLESRHGVKVGATYINESAGKVLHYIAESMRQE